MRYRTARIGQLYAAQVEDHGGVWRDLRWCRTRELAEAVCDAHADDIAHPCVHHEFEEYVPKKVGAG